MTFKDLLIYLTTPAAGAIAYWLIEQVAWLANLKPEWKRAAAYILTGLIAVGAWGIQIGMGYVVAPVELRQWIEAIFAVWMAAFGVSQLVHGVFRLPTKIQAYRQ